MKLPKLNLITTKDDLRPPMANIYINKDEVVAVDGNALIVHDKSLVDCLEGLPEECYIPGTEWVELTKEFETAKYIDSEKLILLTDKKGKKRVVSLAEDQDQKFPNYRTLIERFENVEAFEVSFNPKVLVNLTEAASVEFTACKVVTGEYNRLQKVIFYTRQKNGKIGRMHNVEGYIMPMILED